MHNGLALSTFHSLKGLEYDNVFMIYLDNEITPNFPRIEDRPYSNLMKESLKEAEVRLFYVAMTRAKNNLYLYYNESNPSVFLKYLWEYDKAEPAKTEETEVNDYLLDGEEFEEVSMPFDEDVAVDDALADDSKILFNKLADELDETKDVIHMADVKIANESTESSTPIASLLNKDIMKTLLSRIG